MILLRWLGHTFQPDLVKRIRRPSALPVWASVHVPAHSGDTGHPGRAPCVPPCFWSSQLDACSCFIYSCFMLPGNPIPILFSLPSFSLSLFF